MKKLLIFPILFLLSCSTEPEAEPKDCVGIEGGNAVIDDCGICEGDDNNGDGFCQSDLDALLHFVDCSLLFDETTSPFNIAKPGDTTGGGNGICDEGEMFVDELNGIYDEGEVFIDEGCWLGLGDGLYNGPEPYIDENGNGTYDAGEPFTDCRCSSCDGDINWNSNSGNGMWDNGEDFTDAGNGNGFWDSGEGFTDTSNGQTWENGRLTYLVLFSSQLTCVPESIGDLTALESIFLSSNQLISLPQTVCNLQDGCNISLGSNNLCEQYHYDCISDWNWGNQDQSNCCEGENGEPNWIECP